MRKFIIQILFIFLIPFELSAQDQQGAQISLGGDSSASLQSPFLHAQWQLHSRTFFMSTINEGHLKDDYTLATGAGIGILTEPFHGFQIGMNGFFIFELVSSDIDKPDPTTNVPNRYELGLYDVTNPGNTKNLSRLEELYLKYSWKKNSVVAGRFNINTPFINIQDGRMRPTLEEGVWLNLKPSGKFSFQGGWIHKVLPRSTMSWYKMGNSLGIYAVGVNENGLKSGYSGNVESEGLAIMNLTYQPAANWNIIIWNGFFENVLNTAIIEVKQERKTKKNSIVYHGLMFLHQDAVGNGGNDESSKTYISKGDQSNVISAQVGIKNKQINSSINYTRITGDGRYLLPREWGREFFYTFLPRERNEGAGDVNAIMTKTSWNSKNMKFKTGVGYGFYEMPDVKKYRLNKYGMPSYHQINYEASYAFSNFLKGFELRTLVAWKINSGETYDNPKYVYNKTDMLNLSIVLDFKI